MMKTLITLAAATLAANLIAAPTPTAQNAQRRTVTPEQREKMKKAMGDRIEKPGSQKGKIAFIDTQADVSSTNFEALAVSQSKQTGYNIVYEKATAGDPVALKAASKADVAVIIAADDKSPVLLSAIEDGWAVVNVRKLGASLKSDDAKAKFWAGRCQKEVLRALASVAGGFTSQYPNNCVSATKVTDLDLCNVFIPNDSLQKMRKCLAERNVTPKFVAFYRQACQQGWAPAPTNDVQKAIWEKVHQLPTKPIKIEFDPKTDTK